jgi:hypothetical protein
VSWSADGRTSILRRRLSSRAASGEGLSVVGLSANRSPARPPHGRVRPACCPATS